MIEGRKAGDHGRVLRYGMVGGGPGSFIGRVHRAAISLEGCGRLVAGCFSQSEEKNRQEGQQLGLDPERVYATFSDMALAEAGRNDPIPDP